MQDLDQNFAPRPLPEQMIDQLILAAEAVVRYRIATYRDRFKLTELQYRMMMHVAAHGPISVGQLAGLVDRDVAQVSRSVKLLVDTGLMTSRRRRGTVAKALELSAEGKAVYRQMARIGEEWELAVARTMPPADILAAARAMERLNTAAHDILGRDDGGSEARVCQTRRDRRRANAAQGGEPLLWPG